MLGWSPRDMWNLGHQPLLAPAGLAGERSGRSCVFQQGLDLVAMRGCITVCPCTRYPSRIFCDSWCEFPREPETFFFFFPGTGTASSWD